MIGQLQSKRFWLAGGAALALLIVVIGWVGVISPQLSSAKTLRESADSARTQNSVLAVKTAKLKKQNDNVGQLKTTLRTALAALPFDGGLPTFTRQLATQATQNKVVLSSITIGAATSTAAGTTPTAATPTAATPATTAPTTTTGAVPSTAAAPTAVMTIPVTLLCKGSSTNRLAFLRAIQVGGPRRALVTATTVAGAGTVSVDKSATMTIQLSVFSTPMSAAARAQLAKLLSAK